MIQHIYWKKQARVRVENDLSEYKEIKRGVRQGCVLSPDMFSLYSEVIMRHIRDLPGMILSRKVINNIRYADDTALLTGNEKDLQKLVDVNVVESEKMVLSLNEKKTEVIVVSRNSALPETKIFVKGAELKQVHIFKYLGTVITSDGRSKHEINTRIEHAKTAFKQMYYIFRDKNISMELNKRLVQCYVEPILMYGCESWTVDWNTR